MMEYVREFSFTNWMGGLLYWLPLSFCVYGYTIRTWLNYQKDVTEREKAILKGNNGFYCPTDTIGTLIGRAIVTITPVANLWAASFDLAPRIFASMFNWLGKVFDMPLVPRIKEKQNEQG